MINFGINDEDLINKRNIAKKPDRDDDIVLRPILSIEPESQEIFGYK